MPSLDELLPGVLGNMAEQGAIAESDAAVGKFRLQRNLQQRTIPNLMNYYASRGTFRSGHANLKTAQAVEDSNDQAGDIDRLLSRQRADLTRKRILATAGMFV